MKNIKYPFNENTYLWYVHKMSDKNCVSTDMRPCCDVQKKTKEISIKY